MTTPVIEQRCYGLPLAARDALATLRDAGDRVWVERPRWQHKHTFCTAISRTARHRGMQVAVHSMKVGRGVLVERVSPAAPGQVPPASSTDSMTHKDPGAMGTPSGGPVPFNAEPGNAKAQEIVGQFRSEAVQEKQRRWVVPQ